MTTLANVQTTVLIEPAPSGGKLSPTEAETLAQCEAVIRRDIESFIQVGNALATIKAGKLYRVTHSSWADYVRETFDLEPRRAQQITQSCAVVRQIENAKSFSLLPLHEGQVRPLTSIPSDKVIRAWQEAIETAEDNRITSRHVARVARQFKPAKPHQACPALKFLPRPSTNREKSLLDRAFKILQPRHAVRVRAALNQYFEQQAQEAGK